MMIYILALLFTLNSYADPKCTQGPECVQIRSVIQQIKDAKAKRHEDVSHFGRKSPTVKQDDAALGELAKKDRELRKVRKTDLHAASGQSKKRQKHKLSTKKSKTANPQGPAIQSSIGLTMKVKFKNKKH